MVKTQILIIMVKKILFVLGILISSQLLAQVGIGTTLPTATLDVTALNPTGGATNVDGLLVPRVDRRRARFMAGVPTSTIIYVNNLNNAQAGQAANIDAVGFYHFDGAVWQKLNAAAGPNNDWSLTGNAGTTPATNFLGTTDLQDLVMRTNNLERMRIKNTGAVGINITDPRGALDINSATQGMIPPRVALTSTMLEAPVVNPAGGPLVAGTLVWNTNTAGVIPNNVAPGMYYWDGTRWISLAGSPGGLDWSIIGNGGIDGGVTGVTGVPATTGTHFVGTYDITNFDVRTSGLPAARFSSLGEFFIGAIETVLPGDLMNAVSEGNAIFPWAVNGYTDQNGGGVYGSVTGGNTAFAAVQGEYDGTSNVSAGVRGTNFNSIAADGNAFFDPISGTSGSLPNTAPGTYSRINQYGVYGANQSNTGRIVGGVHGVNFQNGAYGMIGYERSNGANVGVLGNTNYSNAGARTQNGTNASVGVASQGGFLGLHTKGNQYGTITKGEVAGIYSDGVAISNNGFAVIDKDINGNKTATYVPSSITVDVSTKGTGKLVNGYAKIYFDKTYSSITSKERPVIVTVSPMGETNGVYVSEVTNDGFTVKENSNGTSNASFYWIAIGEKIDSNQINVSKDLLKKDFDENLDSFLTIDESSNNSKALWWNGNNLEFGEIAPVNPSESKAMIPSLKPEQTQRLDPSVKRVKKSNLRASQIEELKKSK